jgi:hypothetical protein
VVSFARGVGGGSSKLAHEEFFDLTRHAVVFFSLWSSLVRSRAVGIDKRQNGSTDVLLVF